MFSWEQASLRKLARLDEIRAMLNWLEDHLELMHENIYLTSHVFVYPEYKVDDDTKREQVLEQMRPLVRSLSDGAAFGEVRKIDSEFYYGFERKFGDRLVVSVCSHNSNVCTYVDSGEIEDVEVLDIPDEIKNEYRKVVSRNKMVRVCPPLLLEQGEL